MSSRLDDFRLGAGLYLVDNWRHVVARDGLWSLCGGPRAFALRWAEQPVPEGADAWNRRLCTLSASNGASTLGHWRAQRIGRCARAAIDMRAANAGPCGRTNNSLQVSVAVDAHLHNNPATALAWPHHVDPVLDIGVAAAIGLPIDPVAAKNVAEVRRIVSGWGVGAKGLLSVRRRGETALHVLNVVHEPNHITFLDCSSTSVVDAWGNVTVTGSPTNDAHRRLALADDDGPFACMQLWRTADLADAAGVPDDFHARSQDERHALLDTLVPAGLTAAQRGCLFARVDYFETIDYTRWVLQRVRRGECTTMLSDYEQLVSGGSLDHLVPLTSLDAALAAMIRLGRPLLFAETVEIVLPDTEEARALMETFPHARRRHRVVDGVPGHHVEVCLDHRDRHRTGDTDPQWSPPPATWATDHLVRNELVGRSYSWVDTNRAVSPGSRKTNCWNACAAVANFLGTGSVSTSLPMYPGSGFRPTIAQFRRHLGAGAPVFVATRAEAEAAVAAWGVGHHGVLAATLNESSTHMFNAYFDGGAVWFLDGHVGTEGDHNFEIDWERIGVMPIGPLAPEHLAVASVAP